MAKLPKKPRAISLSLEPHRRGFPTFHLSVHDEGDANIPAPFSGHAELDGRRIASVCGTIEGLSFQPPKLAGKSGRKPATARHAAIALCVELEKARLNGKKGAAYEATRIKFHYGAENREVRRIANSKNSPIAGAKFVWVSIGDYPKKSFVMAVFTGPGFSLVNGELIFDGTGWYWSYEEKEAQYGQITGSTTGFRSSMTPEELPARFP